MAEEKHLSRAPIEEAVVEIRVTPIEGRKVEDLEVLCEQLAHRYPKKMVSRQFSAEVKIEGGTKTQNVDHWLYGYRIESDPKTKVVQLNADLFSFSWLRPYETWEAFVGEAQRNWNSYRELWQPTSVTRVGTRFVNRLLLPTDNLDFDQYFTAFPRVPPALPQMLLTFLSRVVVPIDQHGTTATVSIALEDVESDEKISVILDIDVACEGPHLELNESIWNVIDSFRALKNKAFFGSLTEKAIALYL